MVQTVRDLMGLQPLDRESWVLRSILRLQSNADSEKDHMRELRNEIVAKFDLASDSRSKAESKQDARLRKIEYALIVLTTIMAGREALSVIKLGL